MVSQSRDPAREAVGVRHRHVAEVDLDARIGLTDRGDRGRRERAGDEPGGVIRNQHAEAVEPVHSHDHQRVVRLLVAPPLILPVHQLAVVDGPDAPDAAGRDQLAGELEAVVLTEVLVDGELDSAFVGDTHQLERLIQPGGHRLLHEDVLARRGQLPHRLDPHMARRAHHGDVEVDSRRAPRSTRRTSRGCHTCSRPTPDAQPRDRPPRRHRCGPAAWRSRRSASSSRPLHRSPRCENAFRAWCRLPASVPPEVH